MTKQTKHQSAISIVKQSAGLFIDVWFGYTSFSIPVPDGVGKRRILGVVRRALVNAIRTLIYSCGHGTICWLDEGFENTNQRIRFTAHSQRFLLRGVELPDADLKTLPFIAHLYRDGRFRETLRLRTDASSMNISTLERIACEVYNNLRDPEKDDEWDIYLRGAIEKRLMEEAKAKNHPKDGNDAGKIRVNIVFGEAVVDIAE